MKKAIFFDLDGTLWDAVVPIMLSYNEAMENNLLKYRFDEKTVKSYMGLTPIETVRLAFTDVDEETGLHYFKICLENEIKYLAKHPGKLYENEEKVLQILSKKYPLYIVSNSDKGYIENYLNAYKMDKYFKGHLCAGDTGLEKWKNIQVLQGKEKIDAVIYVGDTLKDYVESTKAGVKFIHAAYGFGIIDNAPYKINNLEELIDLVDKIFNDLDH